MKKYFILVLTTLLICIGTISALANPKTMQIELIHDNFIFTADDLAYVDENEVFVPGSFLQKNIYQMTYEEGSRQLHGQFSMPKIRLNANKADDLLFKGFEINLPTKVISNKPYVNIYGMDKLFGSELLVNDKEEKVIITLKKYTFFNPANLSISNKKVSRNEKISLVWQPTFEDENNLAKIDKIQGVNVVSPCWFSIDNQWGLVKNQADIAYVKAAKEKGYSVWPLITNSFDPDLTKSIVHNPNARKNVIKQLLLYVALYNLDGINLDFENIYEEDREAVSVFVQEISDALHELNVIVSIDVTVPSNVSQWSLSYDRKAYSKSVDYVMLMAYDEHWRTSPVSGSVASIGWVEQGVENTLKEVPADKLILGIPLYMREWKETNQSGKTKVEAKTLSMMQSDELIKKHKVKLNWLADKGQNYFEFTANNAKYRVWVEDERSIQMKLDLVHQYKLAGVAGWRKGFEKSEIWKTVNETLFKQ
ncbi:glycosyl hydrolase family 18 protein [Anaerosinus gibii]|uniref:Glycosyl hydrolase family 18 protein n=1 Tax=Selenobaculum gibii TaxID=3054208 RepID=A0A9Y2AKW8_9FIRM|nr:glycosyl hydrolase family 18 protein [Selenobaculum gbiensis]WIW71490.1 glycosyl hydrolase family 18 protein [Selenobaculum gbiensis]